MTNQEPLTSFDKIADWPVDNVAAALIRDGELAHTLGDDEHVFAVASVTKPVAAYGFAMAVEEGVFEWDTPVGPESSTVRQWYRERCRKPGSCPGGAPHLFLGGV